MNNPGVNAVTENENEDSKLIISSLNLHRLNYKQECSGNSSGNENRLRIPIPTKKRQFGYDEYPNFERQYIQNINIPTTTKTESDNEGAAQIHDDNYYFLMSLLPYLREVPKNRKMAIRHKLQKVFVEEQERKSIGRNNNVPNQNFPAPYSRVHLTDPPHHLAQTPRHPPPPYPVYNQDVVYNYAPSAASASTSASATVPLPNASASTSMAFGDHTIQQQPSMQKYPAPVSLPSGNQHVQQYYNATNPVNNSNNNNNFSGYKTTAVDKKSFSSFNATAVNNNSSFPNYDGTALDNNNTIITYQPGVTGEPQTFTYLQ